MLAEIFNSLPKNIWLEELDFDKDMIILIGYVVKWKEDYLASLDKFIKHLGNEDYFHSIFADIGLKNSRKSRVNNVEVVRFKIECKK